MSDSDEQRQTTPAEYTGAHSHAFGPARHLRSRAKVLPEHARGHNRALVLQTLYHSGPMSRADLSRETGLTRVTISDLVSEFIADGWSRLHHQLDAYVEAGLSKFVIRPAGRSNASEFIDRFVTELLPRQN